MMNDPELEAAPPQRKSIASGRLVMWLMAMSLAGLFMPLYLISTTIEEQTVMLATEQADLDATLAVTPMPNPTEEALRAEYLGLLGQVNALSALEETLAQQHLDWPRVITAVGNYNPAQIGLTALTQAGNTLTVTGRAIAEPAALAYIDTLEASQVFEQVTIQAIQLKTTGTDATGRGTPQPNDKPVEFTVQVVVGEEGDAGQ